MADMQCFIQQFLLTYNSPQAKACTTDAIITDVHYTLTEDALVGEDSEEIYHNTSKSNIMENHHLEPSCRSRSPLPLLQSARNEKVELFPTFSGSENSLNWLKNLQQLGKSLKLTRKQGETESVGKFVQDINRLYLKLDNKISEQDKLQYLRRGLRPQLQHYALSITSLQDFLTVMQLHEQIEKETRSNQQSSSRSGQQQQQQQHLLNRPDRNNYNHQQNNHSTYYESPDYYYRNSHAQTSAQQ
ncbi:unnamed protein product, partial [Rotaria sp. Silwood1]